MNGSQRKFIEGVLKRTISCGRSNFSYIFSVLISNQDQDIDFPVCVGVTLFRTSLFNNGVIDSLQIWTGVYLGTKFSIYVEIF